MSFLYKFQLWWLHRMYVLDSFAHALNSTTDVFHDFELAPTGNFEFSPVCLVFQRHAGLLQLACMVLYIRPTALPREPAGPAWYMDALWSGGGYSNSVARCRRMFWDNAEK